MDDIYIDINCDMGEGIGNEKDLMPFISSCNIACGGHTGDAKTMRAVVGLAKRNNVKIGAHPSYPDKENFGRLPMDISLKKLKQSIQVQIEGLVSILKEEEIPFHHIKAHGALYNSVAKDKTLALIFLDAIKQYKDEVYLYVPYASVIKKVAFEQDFKFKQEAFGDRNYNPDLSLVSRNAPNALIEEPTAVLAHVLSIVKNKEVQTLMGDMVKIEADTICIHGDTPSALEILTYLSEQFSKHNIQIGK